MSWIRSNVENPVSIRGTSYSYQVNRNNHYTDMTNTVFDIKKNTQKFQNKSSKTNFQHNSSKM